MLVFPVGTIGRLLRKNTGLSVEGDSSRFVAAVMEFITAEILEFAGDEKLGNRNMITLKAIRMGINKDELLRKFYFRCLKEKDVEKENDQPNL
jgi:hypothetical protein